MDFAQHGVVMTREQEILSTKKRLEAFQFRRGAITPSQSAPLSPTQAHARSHSRNGSIASMTFSSSTNSMITTASEMSSPSGSRPGSSAGGRSRPNSHHRRRSSVSTRAESADMMGVAVLDLPASSMDDNVNFGDKDSIRRRALLALEGKSEFASSTSTVEIPDLNGQGLSQRPHETHKLSLPMMPSFGLSLTGKRDSFGKYPTPANSLKDQLHTLVEEEEEEEDENQGSFNTEIKAMSTPIRKPVQQAADTSFTDNDVEIMMLTPNAHANSSSGSDAPELSITTPSPIPVRHKPANLTLRPLSLSPSVPALPTPVFTPSPRPGLRPLSLTPSPDMSAIYSTPDSVDQDRKSSRRQSSLVRPPSPTSSVSSQRRQTSTGSMSSIGASVVAKRQSSISYIRSVNSPSPATVFTATCLPTPGATPTSERRQSVSSLSDVDSVISRERRTASEEIFIHQSHASLLARITELERALHSRPHSRPTSIQSNVSTASSEPPNEMLQLVADLKAERDELNRDLDGWRQRIRDLEHAKGLLTGRLEKERQDNWIKGEQLGILKVEKDSIAEQLKDREQEISTVSQKLEDAQFQLRQAIQERDFVKGDLDVLKHQLADCLEAKNDIEVQLMSLQNTLAAERAYREQLLRQLDATSILKTPGTFSDSDPSKRMIFGVQQHGNGLGFRSIDSACTTVDAEDGLQFLKRPFTLKAVEEESEIPEDQISDQDDELARYEDEDDSDLSMSMSNSSFDDDMPRSVSHLRLDASTPGLQNSNIPGPYGSVSVSVSPSPSPSPCPTPVPLPPQAQQHSKNASLSRGWTFPRGTTPSLRRSPEEVDRFFGCLEDFNDNSPTSDSSPTMTMDNKSLFSQRLQIVEDEADENMPPFVLPAQASSERKGMLDVVMEEDEEEFFNVEKVEGGVKFTFSTPVSESSLSEVSPSHTFDYSREEQCAVSFTFPQMKSQSQATTDIRSTAATSSAPPVTPVKTLLSTNSFSTPLNKTTVSTRAFPPSRIPPPSPPRFSQPKSHAVQPIHPPKRKPVPVATFSPAPKVPSSPRKCDRAPLQTSVKLSRTSAAANTPSLIPQFKPANPHSTTSLTSRTFSQGTNAPFIDSKEPSSLPSSRLSFQTLTNFITLPSLSWPPRGAGNVRDDATKSLIPPVYVAREKQLSKLRDRLTLEQNNVSNSAPSSVQAEKCNKCQSGLISL